MSEHLCELVLRHQMRVSNYFVNSFYSVVAWPLRLNGFSQFPWSALQQSLQFVGSASRGPKASGLLYYSLQLKPFELIVFKQLLGCHFHFPCQFFYLADSHKGKTFRTAYQPVFGPMS
jgi:hypothetical protein